MIYNQIRKLRCFWHVAIGPARTRMERKQLFETIRSLGFQDIYFMANQSKKDRYDRRR